jgi:RHS repeat-associated protein
VREDGLSVRYLYDPLGRRIAESCGGETTWFGWDDGSNVEELRTDGGRTRRVYDRTGYGPLLESADGESFSSVLTAGAGTPWGYVDTHGDTADVDLTAWGSVARKSGSPGPLRFAGQRADARTGLHYNHNRWYAADLHTFVTPDPLGFSGSDQDVGFVPNVTFFIDPWGLLTIVHSAADEAQLAALGRKYPGANFVPANALGPGSISPDERNLYIDAHGVPGRAMFGGQSIDGTQMGSQLTAAGFRGGPGSQVVLGVCNGATPGQNESSVAQQLANQTGATVGGPLANDVAAAQENREVNGDVPGTFSIYHAPTLPTRFGVHEGSMVVVRPE